MTLEQLSFCLNLNQSVQFDNCLTELEKILAIASKVNEMITQINTNTDDIAEIVVDANLPVQNASDIDALEVRMTTVEGDIVVLDTRLDTIDAQLITINTSLSGNASAIALNSASISAVEVRLGTVEGDIVTLQGDLTTLTGRVTTAEGDIVAIDTRLTTAEGNITALDVRLTTAEGKITTLEADVTQLRTDVDNISLGATQLITSFLATNPSASKLEITLADDFVDNGVYFLVNPRTLDGTGMTISKDAGVTELAVKDETGVQVIGSAYNGNDVVWVRYRQATTDFVMLTPVSVSGFETRLSNVEAELQDKLDLSGGTMTGNINMGGKILNNLPVPSSSTDATTKNYVDNKEHVIKYTTFFPNTWVLVGDHYEMNIGTGGNILSVDDEFKVFDVSLTKATKDLVASADIFYATRQSDTIVKLFASNQVDLSSVQYAIHINKNKEV